MPPCFKFYGINYIDRCGIEVLDEVKWIRYDKNGKCLCRRWTNNELKRRCKMNGIKGYSKMYKLELLKALMGV